MLKDHVKTNLQCGDNKDFDKSSKYNHHGKPSRVIPNITYDTRVSLWAKIPRISTMVTNTSAPPTLPATTPVWELVVSKQKNMFLLSPCVAKLNGFILTNQYYRNSYLCLEIKKSFFHKINIIYMGLRSNTWHFFQTNIH